MAQAIPIALAVAGSALQAGGTLVAADARSDALKGEASQLGYLAGQDRASSQRSAYEERRNARLLQSRALAVAGASGGGVSDPTVVNLMARLSGEGEYRALTALYEGEEQARQREAEAKARRKEAKSTKTAGYLSAAGSVLQGASTLYTRFGNGGPTGSGT